MRNLWGCFLLWPLPWNLLPRAYFTAPRVWALRIFKDVEGKLLEQLHTFIHIYIHIDVNLDGTHCWSRKWMASRHIAQHSTEEGAQLAYGTPSLDTSYLLYISVCMFSRNSKSLIILELVKYQRFSHRFVFSCDHLRWSKQRSRAWWRWWTSKGK